MKLVKVAGGGVNQTPLDWCGNKPRVLAAVQAARADSDQCIAQ